LVSLVLLLLLLQTVTTVVMLTFLLVGGYYVRNIPVWIGWIRYLSFLYWGYNLLIKTQFRSVSGVLSVECWLALHRPTRYVRGGLL